MLLLVHSNVEDIKLPQGSPGSVVHEDIIGNWLLNLTMKSMLKGSNYNTSSCKDHPQ